MKIFANYKHVKKMSSSGRGFAPLEAGFTPYDPICMDPTTGGEALQLYSSTALQLYSLLLCSGIHANMQLSTCITAHVQFA